MKIKIFSLIMAANLFMFLLFTPASFAVMNSFDSLPESGVPDTKSLLDFFQDKEVISQNIAASALRDTTYSRASIIKTDWKYPFIMVEDVIEGYQNSGQENIISSKAVVADHVVVKLKQGAKEEQLKSLIEGYGWEIRKRLVLNNNWFLVSFDIGISGTSVYSVIETLKQQEIVEVAEPDGLSFASLIPDDPRFNELWGLHNTGEAGGTAHVDIGAANAWDIEKGSRDVVVAVIDSGIDYNHEDLKDNMWQNPGEIPDNGVDDDNNGFIDDVYGWDFYNEDNDPMDDYEHGTHCAGIIGAVGGNGQGIVGVNWKVRLAALKFMNNRGGASSSDAAEAVNYAVKMKMPITSCSWGGRVKSALLEEAFKNADQNNILTITAAGNFGSDNDEYPTYPAGFDIPGIISVAATDRNDQLAEFSNYGITQVDLAAPGVEILSTVPGGGYELMDGTSMAAPYVSGAAALLKAYKSSLTNVEIKDLILNNVDPVDGLEDKTSTGGRLNVYKALKVLVPSSTPVPTPVPTPVRGKISVKMSNPNVRSSTNSIHINYLLTNEGDNPINLADVKLRYFYTIDNEADQKYWCDWCTAGVENTTGSFSKITSYTSSADHYFELGFKENTGYIEQGQEVEVNLRITKTDWSAYNQSDDFSFNNSEQGYQVWDMVAGYIKGALVWGNDPEVCRVVNNTPVPSASPSDTISPTITPTPESSPVAGSLEVKMFNADTRDITGTISPNFQLVNTGDSPISLKDVKLRYYFSVNGDKNQNFWCDWSNLGNVNVTGTFVKSDSPSEGFDYYLEIGFSDSAGSLVPGETVIIRTRFTKADWSDYYQMDDYSFNKNAADFIEWDKVTAYVKEELVWGIKP